MGRWSLVLAIAAGFTAWSGCRPAEYACGGPCAKAQMCGVDVVQRFGGPLDLTGLDCEEACPQIVSLTSPYCRPDLYAAFACMAHQSCGVLEDLQALAFTCGTVLAHASQCPYELQSECCFAENPCGLGDNGVCECYGYVWEQADCPNDILTRGE